MARVGRSFPAPRLIRRKRSGDFVWPSVSVGISIQDSSNDWTGVAAGSLIVVAATATGGTDPVVGSGFTAIGAVQDTNSDARTMFAYKPSATGSETTVAFANASRYAGCAFANAEIGAAAVGKAGGLTYIPFSAISPLEETDGTSAIALLYYYRNSANFTGTPFYTGFTNQQVDGSGFGRDGVATLLLQTAFAGGNSTSLDASTSGANFGAVEIKQKRS